MLGGRWSRSASEQPAVSDPGGHTYRLKFLKERHRPGAEVEFTAPDAYQAFVIAHHEGRQGKAELWRDGKKLCSICSHGGSFWEIT